MVRRTGRSESGSIRRRGKRISPTPQLLETTTGLVRHGSTSERRQRRMDTGAGDSYLERTGDGVVWTRSGECSL